MFDRGSSRLACKKVEVAPEFEFYEGDQPASYVISKNLHRRHLNKSQSAMIATEFKPLLEEEAEKRRLATLKQYQVSDKELIPEREQGQARDKAGELFNVSGRYVSEAEKIKKEAPEYVDLILQR